MTATATPGPPGAPAAARPIEASERSLAPDVARGLMLLLIAVANIGAWGQFWPDRVRTGHGLDRTALFLEQLLVADRARPLFAVLLGFGVSVMAGRLWARGYPVQAARKVLRRRGWWLLVLGLLHGVLLFFGDILTAYGATVVLASLLFALPNRSLRQWLWVSLSWVAVTAVPLLAFSAAMSVPSDDGGTAALAPGGGGWVSSLGDGAIYSAATVLLAVLTAAFLPLAIAGIFIHRAGWLTRPGDHLPVLRKVFVSGMVVNVVSSLPAALIAAGVWSPGTLPAFLAFYSTQAGGMYAGVGYLCGFALLAHRWSGSRAGSPAYRPGPGPLVRAVAALGERSLTGYLGQSVLLVPLMAPWGLALADDLGTLASYAVASAAWLATLAFAVVLQRRGLRGPAEALLRRLTYRVGPGRG